MQAPLRLLSSPLLSLTALAAAACAARVPIAQTAAPPTPSCSAAAGEVVWDLTTNRGERDALDMWCASVGPPVTLHSSPPRSHVRGMLVVSWNVHVGNGDVRQLLDALSADRSQPAEGRIAVVLLLQEAFRGGASVPEAVPDAMRVPGRIDRRQPADDIVAVALATGLSLAYVPSMRNGRGSADDRQDRGVAILSSEPISDVRAIELPFGHQRRVAIMATVDPAGPAPPVQVISAHLDLLRGTQQQARRLADYVAANLVWPTTIMGIDTNAVFGSRSRAVRIIDAVVPRLHQCGSEPTNRWLARIDFIFSNLVASSIDDCETLSRRYGSDHAPVVLKISL